MFANSRRPQAAVLLGSVLVFTSLISSTPAVAQVSGAIVIDGGPVRGEIAVGEPVFAPRPVIIYQPVYGRRMEVARYAPQVVFVERSHGRYGKPGEWYRRHGYRPVTLYYSEGRYFSLIYADRRYRWGGAFRPVTAWERGGRFYLAAGYDNDQGYVSSYDRNSSHGHDRHYDRPNGDGRDWDE